MTTLVTLGTDSSGRMIRESREFAAALDQVYSVLGWRPVITQGGHMGDDAAEKSGPTHDGDAADFRVRNLTAREVDDLVCELRAHGIAAWLRNVQHGGFKDPHVHAVPGRWAHPSPSALRQWDACQSGHDGLKGNGPDYHPYALASTPPEDDMFSDADRAMLTRIDTRLANLQRVEKLRFQITQTNDAATKAALQKQLTALQKQIAAED